MTESLHVCLTALLCNSLHLLKPIFQSPLSSPHPLFYLIWVVYNQGMGRKRARPQTMLSTQPSMWASPLSISTTWGSRQWSRRPAKRLPTPFWLTIKSKSQIVKLRNIKTKSRVLDSNL